MLNLCLLCGGYNLPVGSGLRSQTQANLTFKNRDEPTGTSATRGDDTPWQEDSFLTVSLLPREGGGLNVTPCPLCRPPQPPTMCHPCFPLRTQWWLNMSNWKVMAALGPTCSTNILRQDGWAVCYILSKIARR